MFGYLRATTCQGHGVLRLRGSGVLQCQGNGLQGLSHTCVRERQCYRVPGSRLPACEGYGVVGLRDDRVQVG